MPIFVNASFLSIYPMTGLSRYALAMSMALHEHYGEEVIFLTPRAVRPISELDHLHIEHVGTAKKRLIWEQYDLPRYLRRIGNPLLLSFGNTAPLFYNNQIVSILDVFYHHIKDIVGDEQSAYPWRDIQFYKFITKQIARRSRFIITISNYSKQDIIGTLGVPARKVDIVYPTISDLFLYNQDPCLPNPQAGKGDYILGVSSVTPHKNFGSLISAYRQANLPNTRLVIAGNMPSNSTFKDFADERIEFTGYVDDTQLKALYQHAKLFAYPSKFEGFGIPPLEAIASGCPTLVANVASMPEVCGEGSLYVNPYSLDSITAGLITLDCDDTLRQMLVEKGRERLLLYDKTVSARRLVEIVEQHRS